MAAPEVAAITSGFESRLSAAAGPAFRDRLRLVDLRWNSLVGIRPSLCRQSQSPLVITDSPDYLLVLGQTATLFTVGIDDRLVHIDVEDADRALLQLRLNGGFLLDGGRQTGGRANEASLVAIDDLNLLDLAHFA